MVCPIACWGLLEPSGFTKAVNAIFIFFIPQANMPLFTCLSGYLFAHLYESKKDSYTTFRGILKNKFNRLVVPFLIIGH
jgi:fucose 4-O-acetylase-like acetyltransferase